MEVLVIIAVIGILISVALPQFSKIKENQVLKNGVSDILSSIDKARSQTLASLNSSPYGVHFQSDRVIIFTGTTFSAGASGNETISIVTPASITNVAIGGVSGTTGTMYFNRLSGSPSPSTVNTITISTSNFSKIITISATGVASSD